MIWTDKIDQILEVGKPLFENGIKNWALKKEDALIAIEKINLLDIAILGGDVYKLSGNSLEPNYDNWYSDKMPGESSSDFIKRSYLKSREYIEGYQSNATNEIFFAIVPG